MVETPDVRPRFWQFIGDPNELEERMIGIGADVDVKTGKRSLYFRPVGGSPYLVAMIDGTLLSKNNLNASVAPTVDDDIDAGYDYGSLWLDIVTNVFRVCKDPAPGAAVWEFTGGVTSHEDLVNKNSETDVKHVTDAQLLQIGTNATGVSDNANNVAALKSGITNYQLVTTATADIAVTTSIVGIDCDTIGAACTLTALTAGLVAGREITVIAFGTDINTVSVVGEGGEYFNGTKTSVEITNDNRTLTLSVVNGGYNVVNPADAQSIWDIGADEIVPTESGLGDNIVANHDFSDGTTGFTAGSGTVVSIEDGVLRIAYGSSNNPYVNVAGVLTVGTVYKTGIEVRSDGAAIPTVSLGSSSSGWTGTISTDWQCVDIANAAAGVNLIIQALTTVSSYIEVRYAPVWPVISIPITAKKYNVVTDESSVQTLELNDDYAVRNAAGEFRSQYGGWFDSDDVDAFLMDEVPEQVAAMQQAGLIKNVDNDTWTATPVDGELYRPRGSNDYEIRKFIEGSVAGQKDDFYLKFSDSTTIAAGVGAGSDSATFTTDVVLDRGEAYSLHTVISAYKLDGSARVVILDRWDVIAYDGEINGSVISKIDSISGASDTISLDTSIAAHLYDTGPDVHDGKIEYTLEHSVTDDLTESTIVWVVESHGSLLAGGVGDFC